MSMYKLGEMFSYQDANDIKRLWGSETSPADPGEGEVWLDTSVMPIQLKRYNGGVWEVIAGKADADLLEAVKNVDGTGSGLDADLLDGIEGTSLLRGDVDDQFSGTLTSSKTSGSVINFDNGHSCITVHDGFGNFNIKSGVDKNHEIIESNGGAHIELSEAGKITLAVSAQPVGNTFTDDVYIDIDTSGVTINGQTVWHGGNGGAGSGLEADLLDGQEGSFYQNADNLNAGSVSRARLSELGDVSNPYICAGKTNVTYAWYNINYGVAYTSTPKVVTTVNEAGRVARVNSVTTTWFQVQREQSNHPDYTFDTGYVYWIAFGNRA